MDDRLQRALEQANYNLTIQTQKKNHQLRFQNAIVYAAHGGTFTANPALISFVDSLCRHLETEAVLIDDRGNPIMVPDLPAFSAKLVSVYTEATNEFYASMEKLRRARTTKLAVGL